MKVFYVILLIVFAHTATSQNIEEIHPEWIEFGYPDAYRPSYTSFSITGDKNDHIYWPVCDYDQTTLFNVDPTANFRASEICRLRGDSEYSNPSVRAIQWYKSNLYVSGLYYHSPHASSTVGFIACVAPSKKDTLWLRLVADSFNLSSTLGSIAVDTSGVYACADGPTLCRYTHGGERIWVTGLGKAPVYVCRSLVVDDSFIYVCGGLPASINFPNDNIRACVLKFKKINAAFVDSLFLDIYPGASRSGIASQIALKDRAVYVVGTSYDVSDTAMFAAKLDRDLTINWFTTWNYEISSEGVACTVDSDGSLWVACKIKPDTIRSVLLCFSPSGDLVYQGVLNPPYHVEIKALAFVNHKIFAAGGCSYDPPNVYPSVQQTAFLLMIKNPLFSDVRRVGKSSHCLSISPNPFEQKTVLTFDNCADGKMYMEVINSIGKVMLREEIVDVDGLQQYSADLSMLVPGAYHIRLVCPADGWSATANVVKMGW